MHLFNTLSKKTQISAEVQVLSEHYIFLKWTFKISIVLPPSRGLVHSTLNLKPTSPLAPFLTFHTPASEERVRAFADSTKPEAEQLPLCGILSAGAIVGQQGCELHSQASREVQGSQGHWLFSQVHRQQQWTSGLGPAAKLASGRSLELASNS